MGSAMGPASWTLRVVMCLATLNLVATIDLENADGPYYHKPAALEIIRQGL